MNLVKCPNGHFYDAARFGNKCPLCGMSGVESNGDQTTVPMSAGEAASVPPTVPLQAAPAVPPTEKVEAGAPSYEDDRTIPVPGDMVDGALGSEAPVVGWLVCVGGVNKGADYRLHQGRNFIGRAASMDVYIAGDNTVSRTAHAVVVYDPRSNVYLAQPGDSKELFYLNDTLVLNTVALKARDVLSVGNTRLLFVPLCGEDFHW